MSLDNPGRPEMPSFLQGGGHMGERIRAFDWASTPLGDPATWPLALHAALGICLHSSFPTAIYWGPELRLFYNDAWAPIPAERHPAALGQPGAAVWPDIWDIVGPQFDRVIETGEGFSTFDQMLPMVRDGEPRETYWNYSFTPIRDDDGRVAGIFNQGHEVTDKIFADRRQRFLLALTDRLRGLADPQAIVEAAQAALGEHLKAGRVGYGEVDPTARWFTTESNWTDGSIPPRHGVHDLEGFGPDIVADLRAGRPLVVHDVTTDPRTASAEAQAAFAAIDTRAVLTASLVKEGRMRAALYVHNATPRRWSTGDVELVAAVAERTWAAVERATAEAKLRASEARLRRLNETLEAQVAERTADRDRMWRLSTDMMVVARMDGTITAVNPAWTRLLGWPESELLGAALVDFIHPDDRAATTAELDKLGQGITTFRFENRYRASDGGYRWISWIAVPDAGLVHGVGRDVTAEKLAAIELAQAQEALRQSQKMEAMGQLTGGVAHDFNNLLTPIVGSLDMLQRRGLGGDREQRLIDSALQSAERAKTLVQRLLAFARRQPLQPTAVDIGAIVGGMADLIGSTSGPRIRLELDLAPGLPLALADANQVEMALLNLAVNARDAMPDGGTLTIAAKAETVRSPANPAGVVPGRYVRLSVADTGTGMDEATLKRAIEPFFSTKGIGKGTGLGLSMVHGLAAQLGGGLSIDSRVGLGTRVELWLPVSEAVAASPGRAETGETPAGAGIALLVDDEELVRMSTADMLADLGYDVVEASSAEEALRRIDAGQRFDLLVTDHLMPGMTGIELAREVRARRPGARVLIVSGYAEMDGVAPDLPRLTKPFRRADLAASLAAVVA